MNQKQATAIAAALGGEAWNLSNGVPDARSDDFAVLFYHPDRIGEVVVIGPDAFIRYASWNDFEAENESNHILYRAPFTAFASQATGANGREVAAGSSF